MNEVSIPLEALAAIAALEGHPLAQDASIDALTGDIRSRFESLPQPPSVRLENGLVHLQFADPPEEDKAQAARLLERARRRASEREYGRVVALCQQALRLQPLLQAARRELASAYVETGDARKAEATLWQALRLDPRDAWSLVTLGRLLLQDAGREVAAGAARIALEAEPANPEALDLLGQTLLRAGRHAEALGVFDRVLPLSPHLLESRLGAARALLRQGRAEESQSRLQELFRQAAHAGNPASDLGPARAFFAEVQEHLAQRDLQPMRQALEDLRRRLEEQCGVPIRLTDIEPGENGLVELAWTEDRDHHLIGTPTSLPAPVRLQFLAQALLRVQLEGDACRAGRLRTFSASTPNEPRWRGLLSEVAYGLRRQGLAPAVIDPMIECALAYVRQTLCHMPIEMLLERRLRAELPIVAPAQFISVRRFMAEPGIEDMAELRRALPRPLWRAALAMDTAHRIFFDELLGGATDFAARCRTQPTYELSLKLLRQWEASSAELRPGDHYGLVDGFAALLGLEGLYEVRECMPPSRQGPGEQAFPT
jgi:cytochrome c-type biogenesis protein CcmH/NrfG